VSSALRSPTPERLSAERLPVVDELTSSFGGGCPACEKGEAVRGGAVLGRGVDEQSEARLGRQFHGLEVEVEIADDGVMQFLVPGAVEAHALLALCLIATLALILPAELAGRRRDTRRSGLPTPPERVLAAATRD